MSEGKRRDDVYDRAVRELLSITASARTVAEADMAVEVIRARLAEKIRLADERGDPGASAILRLVFGRLHDVTESGGTRA